MSAEFSDLQGLHICDTDFTFIKRGHYGAVFRSKTASRAIKVYLRRSDLSHEVALKVFQSECDAYNVASGCDSLKDLIPRHFRLVHGLRICDSNSDDVSETFFPDLAFEMEYIEGPFQKINQIPGSDAIKELFRKHGIAGIDDADVTLTNGKIVKVVDFAMREIEHWHK